MPRGIFSVSEQTGDERPVLEDAMSPQAAPDGSLLVVRINSIPVSGGSGLSDSPAEMRCPGRDHTAGRSHARDVLQRHRELDIMDHMKSLLIELDDDVAAKLELVAPGRARRRSEFIRLAIRRALWELEERATAEAYRRLPDSAAEAHLDPAVWEPQGVAQRRRVRR